MYRTFASIFKTMLFLCLLFCGLASGQALDSESWMWYDDSEIALVEISIDPAAMEWIYDEANWQSDSLHLCSVHFKNAFIDETIDSVGFRLRGNTSREARKKSFKLSFNTFIPGRQIYNIEKLNLNGEHNDPSIMRSKICWDLYQKIGMKASRAAHAAVYINGEYYGLYISVEHIDEEFIENHFQNPDGNLWKCLYPADLTWRGDNPANYYPWSDETRPYELKTNEDIYDYSPLVHFIDIINNTPAADFEDSLETILNIPQFLKYLAVDVMTGSWDDYWALMNNYYLYHDPTDNQFHLIPYDYDNTFGITWNDVDWATADPYEWPRFVPGDRPLADRLIANGRYRNLYTHFLEFYVNEVYDLAVWGDDLDNLKNAITPWAEADTFRTKDYGFTMDDFSNSFTAGDYFNQHVKRGLKNFIETRIASLKNQFEYIPAGPLVYQIDYEPKNPRPADSIRVSVAAFGGAGLNTVDIQLTRGDNETLEIIPMQFDPIEGTTQVENVDRWTGTITPIKDDEHIAFRINAKDKNGVSKSFPAAKPVVLEIPESGTVSLFINEFLARNSTINTDNNGDYDDWLEIYNPTDSTINLAGMYLSDDAENLTRWQFPEEGSEIGAKGFLLVWCDDDTDPSELHTTFKLDGDGEFIALTASDGFTVIDSLSFGNQGEDISFGRSPDGSPVWTSMTPTPAASNNATGIREEHLPSSFELSIYPNPFNPETQIQYSIAQGSMVDLSIFNMLGQKVVTLVHTYQPAGSHKIEWAGTNAVKSVVGAGVYFCRLQVGNNEIVKRVIFLK